MKRYVILYVATAILMAVLDGVWLGYITRDFFRSRLVHLLAPEPNLVVAALFYLLYVVGIMIFVHAPALGSGSWTTALLYGALFGFFVYMTYDLTNLALLKDWPYSIAALDIAWGTCVTGISAAGGFLIAQWLDGKA
jgi:uncharacterized membrane protein